MRNFATAMVGSALLFIANPLLAYNLLTDEQFEELNALQAPQVEEDDEFTSKALTLAPGPTIELIKPKLGKEHIELPLDIELVFSTPDDARIRPDSLRIYYRKWRKFFNVTDTVLENATFKKNRLVSENVEIRKKGKHQIKVTIMDTLDRKSERTFKFRL